MVVIVDKESKTIVGILAALRESFTSNLSLPEAEKRRLKLANDLVALYQNNLVKFKEFATKNDIHWSGEIPLSYWFNEQDGLVGSSSETVNVWEDGTISYQVKNTKGVCGESGENVEVVEWQTYPNGNLWEVRHRISKGEMRSLGVEEKSITIVFNNDKIVRVTMSENIQYVARQVAPVS